MDDKKINLDSSLVLMQELRQVLARLDLALAHTKDGLVYVNAIGEILWCNPRFEEIVGLTRLEMLGENIETLFGRNVDQEPFFPVAISQMRNTESGCVSFEMPCQGQLNIFEMSWMIVKTEEPNPLMLTFSDATLEKEVLIKMYTDDLTGLWNRRKLLETLETSIQEAISLKEYVTLFFIDLDGFKAVNDNFGHKMGDKFLRCVGDAILSEIRSTDMAFRHGGDEFVIVAKNISEQMLFSAGPFASRIRDAIERKARSLNKQFAVSASIGIAHFPDDASSPDDLLAIAVKAMYSAKCSDENDPCFFADSI